MCSYSCSYYHYPCQLPGRTMTTHRRFFALLLLLATATPDSWVQAHVQEAAQASEAVSAVEFPVTKVMEALREMLDEYQSTPFPGLPTINVDQGEIR